MDFNGYIRSINEALVEPWMPKLTGDNQTKPPVEPSTQVGYISPGNSQILIKKPNVKKNNMRRHRKDLYNK